MEFQKMNPMVQDNPEIFLNRDRLIRNVEVNQQVYITLRQQYELAKIDEMNEILVINILDVGEVDVRAVYPRKLMIIISAFILGCILSCLIVYISLIRNRLKEISR
jgi:tyrosine-protein kinase Etk/Wzc